MKATNNKGQLNYIPNCFISVGNETVYIKALPEISDKKSVRYNDETTIGRATPFKTYHCSENRSISVTLHMVSSSIEDLSDNMANLRLLQSACYPEDSTKQYPFLPPVICELQCGFLLASDGEDPLPVNCVLKSCNVKFPTEIAWQKDTYIPLKFDVDLDFDVVYSSLDLPTNDRIIDWGV